MRKFNVAIVDCSYMFRLLQSNRYQVVYFGVAETCSCNLQLLYENCELTVYILLFNVIFDGNNMYYIFLYFRDSAKIIISFKSDAGTWGNIGLECVCFAECGK